MFKSKTPLFPIPKGRTAKQGSFAESNVIRLLKSFSKDELHEFEKLVKSPLYNNRSETTNFFLEVKKYYPSFRHKNFTKEEIYNKLYPKSQYRDDMIRRLSSYLFNLGKEYSAYRMFKKDKYNYEKAVLDYHWSKSQDAFFLKQLKSAESYLEEQKSRSTKYFERVYTLGLMKRAYTEKKESSHKSSNIPGDAERLLQYSVISLLKLYALDAYISRIYNKQRSTKYLDILLGIIEEPDFKKSKAAEMFYLALKLDTSDRNDETFFRLKEMLQKNSGIFDEEEESFGLFSSLLGYCVDKKMVHEKDYTVYEFELVKQMLDTGLLTQTGTMHPEWFMFVFQRAVNVGEIKFAEKFIEDYIPLISGEEKNNVINHARAQLCMVKKDYPKALEYLSTTRYNNANEKHRVNYMHLTIYYEAEMYDSFFYSVDSFRHLLKQESSISSYLRELYENFLKFSSKLVKIKLKETDTTIDELKSEIISSQVMGSKWLLNKIEELENLNHC